MIRRIKISLNFTIILIFFCCKNDKYESKKFYYSFKEPVYELTIENNINYNLTFTLLTDKYSKTLNIQFPAKSPVKINLKDSLKCSFQKMILINNKRKIEKINSGIIEIIEINQNIYDVKVKVDEINFKGIVYKSDKEYVGYSYIEPNY